MSSSNAGRHHAKVKIWFIPTLVAAAVLKKKEKKKNLQGSVGHFVPLSNARYSPGRLIRIANVDPFVARFAPSLGSRSC
jgi:hypothetical protein